MTEIDPDEQSPWWPCPECGGIHFQTACCFERGKWRGDQWEAFNPPSAIPTGIYTQVECTNCAYRFDIAEHYGWPLEGEFRG